MSKSQIQSPKKFNNLGSTPEKNISSINLHTASSLTSPNFSKNNQFQVQNHLYSDKKNAQTSIKLDLKLHSRNIIDTNFKLNSPKTVLPGSLKLNQLKISYRPNKCYLQATNKNMLRYQINTSSNNTIQKANYSYAKQDKMLTKGPDYHKLDLFNLVKKRINPADSGFTNLSSNLFIAKNNDTKKNNKDVKKPNVYNPKIQKNTLVSKTDEEDKFDRETINIQDDKDHDEDLLISGPARENAPTLVLDSLADLDNNQFYDGGIQIQTELNLDRDEDHFRYNQLASINEVDAIRHAVAASCPEIENFEMDDIFQDKSEQLMEKVNPTENNNRDNIHEKDVSSFDNAQNASDDKNLRKNNDFINKIENIPEVNDEDSDIGLVAENNNANIQNEYIDASSNKANEQIISEDSQNTDYIQNSNGQEYVQEETKDDNDNKVQVRKKKIFKVPIYKKSRFYEEHQIASSRTEIPDDDDDSLIIS